MLDAGDLDDGDPVEGSVPDPGLTGQSDRPVAGIDNGYVAGYRVRFDEAGPDGRMRTSALLRYAQDVAWRHSEALGFGRRWYAERGRWWVVRSLELQVVAPVPMGRTLRVSTAVVGHRRIWARRLSDASLGGPAGGRVAARIVTDWVILDDRGRPVRIPEDFGLSFTNPELPGEILRATLPSVAGSAREIRLSVRPQDLDPMGHVNNATYLDWLEEALLAADGPAAVVRLPRRLRLEYLASAEPGDEVRVTTWRDGPAWTARVARADGTELLRAAGSDGEVAGAIAGVPTLG